MKNNDVKMILDEMEDCVHFIRCEIGDKKLEHVDERVDYFKNTLERLSKEGVKDLDDAKVLLVIKLFNSLDAATKNATLDFENISRIASLIIELLKS